MELCKKYPFLIPWNRRSGTLITEGQSYGYWPGTAIEVPKYDFEYTELDMMPEGWRIAFGEKMCEEIKDALLREGGETALHEYRIADIKEKFGCLCWYDYYSSEEIEMIIRKYELISMNTCINCGKEATRVTTGWISPYCDECCEGEPSVPLDEWLQYAHV